MFDTMETRPVRLRDLEAGEVSGCRGVLVSCPRFETPLDIGECLFCEHYKGLWLNDASHCALKCNYKRVPAPAAAAVVTQT